MQRFVRRPSRREFLAMTSAGAAAIAGRPAGVWATTRRADDAQPREIGSRWELFVDEWLLDEQRDAALVLNPPRRAEVALVTDAAWEGPTSAYFSVVQDGPRVRLYYRGSAGGSDASAEQVTCLAESRDGIHFERPSLGLIEVSGSRANGVVWKGVESHNFAPFLDTRPECPAD
jgi:hypothetical protein